MTIERHALIDKATGAVVDIIMLDSNGKDGAWPVPAGYDLRTAAALPVNPGDTWDGAQFICLHPVALCGPPANDASPRAAIDAILQADAVKPVVALGAAAAAGALEAVGK
jgi:hypothetical protein